MVGVARHRRAGRTAEGCRDQADAALEKTLNSKEHQQKAEQLSLEPLVIKGEAYLKFLKDNEQDTKKLMGW